MNEELRAARKAKGITITFLSKKLGYKNPSGYANIEYGFVKPSLENAKIIAELLDVPIDELFFNKKLHKLSNKEAM
ncbi:helix-turn-helix transcriptional regulator [Rummeliibacillus pycnus]|uniref:helix-turn-helix transcriptional regulator n=1 Tax=Rummeliibacillus pycnus TaxID=101070 RepID=UPI0037C9E30C